jgi:hypothetical protein
MNLQFNENRSNVFSATEKNCGGAESAEYCMQPTKPNHTWFTLALRRRNTQQTDSLRYHVVIKALKQQQSQDANS